MINRYPDIPALPLRPEALRRATSELGILASGTAFGASDLQTTFFHAGVDPTIAAQHADIAARYRPRLSLHQRRELFQAVESIARDRGDHLLANQARNSSRYLDLVYGDRADQVDEDDARIQIAKIRYETESRAAEQSDDVNERIRLCAKTYLQMAQSEIASNSLGRAGATQLYFLTAQQIHDVAGMQAAWQWLSQEHEDERLGVALIYGEYLERRGDLQGAVSVYSSFEEMIDVVFMRRIALDAVLHPYPVNEPLVLHFMRFVAAADERAEKLPRELVSKFDNTIAYNFMLGLYLMDRRDHAIAEALFQKSSPTYRMHEIIAHQWLSAAADPNATRSEGSDDEREIGDNRYSVSQCLEQAHTNFESAIKLMRDRSGSSWIERRSSMARRFVAECVERGFYDLANEWDVLVGDKYRDELVDAWRMRARDIADDSELQRWVTFGWTTFSQETLYVNTLESDTRLVLHAKQLAMVRRPNSKLPEGTLLERETRAAVSLTLAAMSDVMETVIADTDCLRRLVELSVGVDRAGARLPRDLEVLSLRAKLINDVLTFEWPIDPWLSELVGETFAEVVSSHKYAVDLAVDTYRQNPHLIDRTLQTLEVPRDVLRAVANEMDGTKLGISAAEQLSNTSATRIRPDLRGRIDTIFETLSALFEHSYASLVRQFEQSAEIFRRLDNNNESVFGVLLKDIRANPPFDSHPLFPSVHPVFGAIVLGDEYIRHDGVIPVLFAKPWPAKTASLSSLSHLGVMTTETLEREPPAVTAYRLAVAAYLLAERDLPEIAGAELDLAFTFASRAHTSELDDFITAHARAEMTEIFARPASAGLGAEIALLAEADGLTVPDILFAQPTVRDAMARIHNERGISAAPVQTLEPGSDGIEPDGMGRRLEP